MQNYDKNVGLLEPKWRVIALILGTPTKRLVRQLV